MNLWTSLWEALAHKMTFGERGAIGWLLIGIVLGAVLIVALLVKLLIPGD